MHPLNPQGVCMYMYGVELCREWLERGWGVHMSGKKLRYLSVLVY